MIFNLRDNIVFLYVFFFQAEDGIRDYKVTGVQTCALPISMVVETSSAASVTKRGNPWVFRISPPSEMEALGLEQYVERSEEHTSELQSPCNLVCRLLLEKKKKNNKTKVLTEIEVDSSSEQE